MRNIFIEIFYRATVTTICTVACITGGLHEAKTVPTGGTKSESLADSCLTPECIHAASRILKNMNPQVNPCGDFYEFACGNYVKSATIQDSDSWAMPALTGTLEVESRLQQIMQDIDESEAPKLFAEITTSYKSCMTHESKDDELGLDVWRESVKAVGGWPLLSEDQWDDKLFSYSYSIPQLFEFVRQSDKTNSTNEILELSISHAPIAWSYLKEGLSNEVVQAYLAYITDVAVYLGADKEKAKSDFQEILSFDIELYRVAFQDDKDRDLYRRYTKTTIGQLNKKYPKLRLKTYSKKDDDAVVQMEMDANTIKRMARWLIGKPKKALANWTIWRWMTRVAMECKGYISQRTKIMHAVIDGPVEPMAKWRKCVRKVYSESRFLVNVLYHGQYLTESMINDATELLANIKQQFTGFIEKAEWLASTTKQHALEKIANIKNNLAACREFILDDTHFDELKLSKGFLSNNRANLTQVLNFIHSRLYQDLQKAKSVWECQDFGEVFSEYAANENYLGIGAGLYTDAFYDIQRPKALNYGAFGFMIGHEVAHSLDDTNRHYDRNGHLNPWWDAASNKTYIERTECLIEQYKNYKIDEFQIPLNSLATREEDIADNLGIKAAYFAYDKWANEHEPEKRLPELDYTPRQLFWISMANSYCSKYRPEFLKSRVYEDPHSPNKFRINGPLSNIPEFSNDFKCDQNSKMNPVKKCAIL